MLPVLQLAAAGPISAESIVPSIADLFRLSQEDVEEKFGNRGKKIVNNINWAQIYLEKAGLLERVRRGTFQLTSEGQKILAERPKRIDTEFLRRFERYRAWRTELATKAAETKAGRAL